MSHFRQSKRTFILAAIGSAAWLGNLRRFPFQVYDNGGAVFLVAYFVLLFVVGVSLLFGELAFWQKSQSTWPIAFANVKPYLWWLGWAWALCCIAILVYYSAVIGRSLDYLRYSLVWLVKGVLPWAGQAHDFFYNTVLHISESPTHSTWFALPVLIALPIVWFLLFLFTRKSATSVGKVVWVTATLPFLTLAILMARAVTLPGANAWFEFLTQVDRSLLSHVDVWLAAAGQLFFSLSVGFGMMITYGALKKDKSEIMGSAFFVILGDTLTSLMSAVLVFGTLWFMAGQQWVAVTQVSSGWPWLAFVTVPEAIAQLPFAQPWFAILFFATLFFLAVDSAMAMLETFTLPLKRLLKSWVAKTTAWTVLVLGCISLVFARENGLYLLDVIDYYINRFVIVAIAVCETLVFIYLRRPLTSYMKLRSDTWAKRIFHRNYFLVARVLLVLFLLYTLIANSKEFWAYGDYSSGFLRHGVGTLAAIFLLSIVLNLMISQKRIN